MTSAEQATTRTGPPTEQADVAVIGGGLAGLAAAMHLVAAGMEVVVLEARDRVGGRVLNIEGPDGTNLDAGGEWVGPGHDRIVALAREVGVETFPAFAEGDHLLHSEGRLLRWSDSRSRALVLAMRNPKVVAFAPVMAADLIRAARRFRRLTGATPPSAPWDMPQAEELDSCTLESWISQNLTTRRGRGLVRAAVASWAGADASQLSLLAAVADVASAGGLAAVLGADESRFLGGSQLIAIRHAERLGAAIRLGCPVRAIRQDHTGATVQAKGVTIRCDEAVVAIPPVLAARIDYDPPLPPERDQLTQSAPMGSAVKTLAVYDEPFWRSDGLSGWALSDGGLVNSTMDNCPPGNGPGVLVGFTHGAAARAFMRLDKNRQRKELGADLARLFGARAATPRDVLAHDWSADPWTRGCYAAHLPPGVLSAFGSALRASCGRIRFAGTEAADTWTGYMEGAVRSGEAVAADIIAERGDAPIVRACAVAVRSMSQEDQRRTRQDR